MDELRTEVAKARRRLLFELTLNVLAGALSVSLFVALIGLAVPKFWTLPVPNSVWVPAWVWGTIGAGVLTTALMVWRKSASPLDTALEIDRRYGLKERISSTLALTAGELETEAGQALVADASQRLRRVDVREQFALRATKWNFLPILPALLVFFLIAFVPNAEQVVEAETGTAEVKKQIERSTEELKKKLAERRKLAENEGLPEAKEIFSELEKQAGELSRSDSNNRKKTLAKLSDMADAIKKRKAEMGDREGLKKQMAQLKNLKPGPADQMAKALKKGDFGKAVKEIQKLQAKLKAGDLDEKQMQQMAEQLQQMADKLQQMADAHKQAMQELEKQIQQAKQSGDMAKAGQLKNQLDKMNQQSPQMNQLSKLAQQLAKAAQSTSQGQPGEASSQMQSIAKSIEQMQLADEQLEMLDDAMAQLADAKSALNCENCGGTGCSMCQGNMGSDGMGRGMGGNRPGMGMGRGQGAGDRPEAETGSRFYDSRVQGEVRRGRAVITGFAGGPNRTGDAIEEVKQAIEAGDAEGDDPLTGARVPRAHRNHARQYFDSLRDGAE